MYIHTRRKEKKNQQVLLFTLPQFIHHLSFLHFERDKSTASDCNCKNTKLQDPFNRKEHQYRMTSTRETGSDRLIFFSRSISTSAASTFPLWQDPHFSSDNVSGEIRRVEQTRGNIRELDVFKY